MRGRPMVTTLLDLAGVGLIVAGVAVVSLPAGLVAGGVAVLVISWRRA